ncbi:MAG: hypothetical protein NZ108_02910, partial [Bacteroidia bacterium]|nr:hypothetical protein [Bacteroidia bacterium]
HSKFEIYKAILEKKISSKLNPVFRWLNPTASKRLQEICEKLNLVQKPIPKERAILVDDINEAQVIDFLKQAQPSIVIVNDIELLSKRLLSSTHAIFVCIEDAVLQEMRGNCCGYWARVYPNHAFGATICLIGNENSISILGQTILEPDPKDSILTYSFYQKCATIPLLIQQLELAVQQRLKVLPIQPTNEPPQNYPTLWQYLKNRLIKGIR